MNSHDSTISVASVHSPNDAPRVRHLRQSLLWPVHLIRNKNDPDAATPWQILRDMGSGSPWHELDDEYRGGTSGFKERHYHEFVSFLPYVQRFLYGEGRSGHSSEYPGAQRPCGCSAATTSRRCAYCPVRGRPP